MRQTAKRSNTRAPSARTAAGSAAHWSAPRGQVAGRWRHVIQTQSVGRARTAELEGAAVFTAQWRHARSFIALRHLPALHAVASAPAKLPGIAATAPCPPGYCCCMSCRNSSGRRAASVALTKPRLPADALGCGQGGVLQSSTGRARLSHPSHSGGCQCSLLPLRSLTKCVAQRCGLPQPASRSKQQQVG